MEHLVTLPFIRALVLLVFGVALLEAQRYVLGAVAAALAVGVFVRDLRQPL